ncbi:MAG: DUF5928 domain-containing protein [Planktomarina sp.]
MVKIVFILLCHKDPAAIIQQADCLTAVGDYVSIHFDGSAPADAFRAIKEGTSGNPNICFAKQRLKCGWGEWSLVQATLNAVQAGYDAFPDATHFYMVSGDCQAIKTAEFSKNFLDAKDVDYIESFDYFESDWIKTGMKEERLIYRHYFNERTQKKRFYLAYRAQQRMGWTRKIPEDIEVMIGSQWWCLRRKTIEWVLDFTRKRKDVMRFFRRTWIPDETFFQTIVRHVVPGHEIETRTLTFLMFTDYGMPVTFYNDHYDLLLSQDFLFARKISPDATDLKERLGDLYAETGKHFQISNEGRQLFGFLTNRGREGRRFAPRFWENESSLGRDRELLIVACKKWHVAKNLIGTAQNEADFPILEYVFSEMNAGLPNLGGIETTLPKRMRHRRSLMRMLFDYYDTNKMLVCVDSSNHELISDFYRDRSTTKLLEIKCNFEDDYLVGHAKRIGLAGDSTPDEVIERLLPTVRQDVQHEHNLLRDSEFPNHFRIQESQSAEENATQIAEFFDIDMDRARWIASNNNLFAD